MQNALEPLKPTNHWTVKPREKRLPKPTQKGVILDYLYPLSSPLELYVGIAVRLPYFPAPRKAQSRTDSKQSEAQTSRVRWQ